jgi:hypothetical protein
MSTYTESPTLTDEPLPQESLAAELVARRRKRLPAVTLALALLVAGAVAFIGGVEVQKHWGATSAPTTGSAFAAARAGGASGFAGPGGRGTFGGAAGGGSTGLSGTVTLIKGSTLYVTSASGNTVLVHTTPASVVTKTVSGTETSIRPGNTVTVVGTAASDGSYTARQVTIGGSNG